MVGNNCYFFKITFGDLLNYERLWAPVKHAAV